MTSKHFRIIAGIIAKADIDLVGRTALARDFADMLASTNPRFDRSRFLAAATGAPLTPGDKPRARDFAR